MIITNEAEEDIDNQEEYDRKKLSKAIKNQLGETRQEEDISYINKPEFGIEFHRLKLMENGLDHRVYFDYMDSEVVFFAVRHKGFCL